MHGATYVALVGCPRVPGGVEPSTQNSAPAASLWCSFLRQTMQQPRRTLVGQPCDCVHLAQEPRSRHPTRTPVARRHQLQVLPPLIYTRPPFRSSSMVPSVTFLTECTILPSAPFSMDECALLTSVRCRVTLPAIRGSAPVTSVRRLEGRGHGGRRTSSSFMDRTAWESWSEASKMDAGRQSSENALTGRSWADSWSLLTFPAGGARGNTVLRLVQIEGGCHRQGPLPSLRRLRRRLPLPGRAQWPHRTARLLHAGGGQLLQQLSAHSDGPRCTEPVRVR